jgi:hypothetical protein
LGTRIAQLVDDGWNRCSEAIDASEWRII